MQGFVHGVEDGEMAAALSRSPLRGQHDIVLVDQRGTGGSNPLRCCSDDPLSGLEAIFTGKMEGDLTSCREQKDLDEVCEVLGHERINLWGASYGSLEALEYVRRHPGRVRALTIQGIMARFLAAGTVEGLDTSCAEQAPRRQFEPPLNRPERP